MDFADIETLDKSSLESEAIYYTIPTVVQSVSIAVHRFTSDANVTAFWAGVIPPAILTHWLPRRIRREGLDAA